MIPWVHVDTAEIPGGEGTLRLKRRGEEFSIMLGDNELMNSRLSGSEQALATLACERLAEFGGFEIAMLVGAMLGAAEAKMTLLIDGFIVGSAALTSTRLFPALTDYCVFCHRSAEPGHAAQLQALGGEPLLDLGLRLGEGTGAALAWPLVRAAAGFLNEMASFASAGVSDKA